MSRNKEKAYIRPIGDGDCIIYTEDKHGNEHDLDTPAFDDYGEAEAWCYENGYEPEWE